LSPILAFWGIEHFTPPWDVFFLPLFNLLVAFYQLLFSDLAIAIIVFTIFIRTVLAPLFVKQIRSQKEMQRMQPLIREVQKKHKGNRQKISEETMALYKEHGVNPAAGCLPVILQMPILFALFWVLRRVGSVIDISEDAAARSEFQELMDHPEMDIEPIAGRANHFTAPFEGPCDLPQLQVSELDRFLPLNCQLVEPLKLDERVDTTIAWLAGLDLADLDRTFGVMLFGGFVLSGLAVVAAVLQFVQVKMTSPRPNSEDPTSGMTSTMIYLFPLLTIVWGGIFPSGLILYWIVYTAYLVVHQYMIMGWGNFFPLFGWQPAFAKVPEVAVVSAPPRHSQADEAESEIDQPSTTRSAGAGKQARRQAGGAPAGQQPRRKKRRGRKR
jgi:YidC/Oxa1 family membrane protein insertase